MNHRTCPSIALLRHALIHFANPHHKRYFPPVALSDIQKGPYSLSDISAPQLWRCQTLSCQSIPFCQTFTSNPIFDYSVPQKWILRQKSPRAESNHLAARPPVLWTGGRCKTALSIVNAVAATPSPAKKRAPHYP